MLSSLDLRGNQLSSLRDTMTALRTMPSLRHLWLAGNPLACTPPDFPDEADVKTSCSGGIASALLPTMSQREVEAAYRRAILYALPDLETLDGKEATVAERVAAMNFFHPLASYIPSSL